MNLNTLGSPQCGGALPRGQPAHVEGPLPRVQPPPAAAGSVRGAAAGGRGSPGPGSTGRVRHEARHRGQPPGHRVEQQGGGHTGSARLSLCTMHVGMVTTQVS